MRTIYYVNIERGDGIAIGDGATATVLSEPMPVLPERRRDLLGAIRTASSELRNCSQEIAGITIERIEVQEILDWLFEAPVEQHLGVLIDRPGGGKTVVMAMVLKALEERCIPVLAIKADALSNIQDGQALARRLELPGLVEDCMTVLSTDQVCVVLFDQLDALSLALSGDQATLDVMLDTLARLSDIERIRVVASCRTFELRHDPRLSSVKIDRTFTLQPLTDAAVAIVLDELRVDPARLLPEHRNLLTVPQHLRTYAQLVEDRLPGGDLESYRSLQDLYGALWVHWVSGRPPDLPSPEARAAAIDLLEARCAHGDRSVHRLGSLTVILRQQNIWSARASSVKSPETGCFPTRPSSTTATPAAL